MVVCHHGARVVIQWSDCGVNTVLSHSTGWLSVTQL